MSLQSTDKKLMVVGFAYGKCATDPGLSNRDLIVALFEDYGHLLQDGSLILQQELVESMTDLYRGSSRLVAAVVGTHRNPGTYLDTHEVARQAIQVAIRHHATDLAILAYPLLHRPLCVRALRAQAHAQGFNIPVTSLETGWIRSDPESLQWWTRNPFGPVLYALKSALIGTRGT